MKNEGMKEMNYPAASGRGIRESFLFAASGGEFIPKEIKNKEIKGMKEFLR